MALTQITIPKTPTFDVGQTLDCGQVFRYVFDGTAYSVFAKNHVARIREDGDNYVLQCDDKDFFVNYFDFDTDYADIQSKVDDCPFMHEAIDFGRGIHILKQDPVEAIFSFIISQNNHIPRIKGIIERICNALGEDMGDYHAFPEVRKLADVGVDFFKSVGAGYRAEYLDRVAKTLVDEDVYSWGALDTKDLRAKLLSLHGVGRKVADCALLFGFGRSDVFPVDTWIKKIYESEYQVQDAEKMSELLVKRYGNYSGFAQQWAFYCKRVKKV